MLRELVSRLGGRITSRRKTPPSLLISQGSELERVGDDDGARLAYLAALQAEPANVVAHLMLGKLFGKRGEAERSLEHLRAVLALEPDCEEAYVLCGNVFYSQGDAETAESYYREALRRDPGSPLAAQNLAALLR